MKAKVVIPRELARRDVDQAVEHYLVDGTFEAALHVVDALERAYTRISRQPTSGSPRYAHEMNLNGLRSWPLARFPYMVLYFEHDDFIDVWRVLHSRRDIPAWMGEP